MLRTNQVFWQNKKPSKSEFVQMQEIFSEYDIPAFDSGTNPEDYVFVAKLETDQGPDSVLGGIVFRIKNFCAEIIAIGVRKTDQRKRIGTSLVKDMEKILIERSVRRIEAKVPNDSRRGFYKFLGYREYSTDRMDRWIPRSQVVFLKIKKAMSLIL
ncbi:MAG: GNAT family N-acetyltransferase [Candidatus Hodarchaeales archaeon]|jgi:ribosomal protein S18 acetylase RimI-like enzyme